MFNKREETIKPKTNKRNVCISLFGTILRNPKIQKKKDYPLPQATCSEKVTPVPFCSVLSLNCHKLITRTVSRTLQNNGRKER
jgi:hypothetical protein